MVISRTIALVYNPVKPCCFNSQVNIYLDDFQWIENCLYYSEVLP